MILNVITVLVPVLFVIGLGYVAGRQKDFDADQVRGINELVLNFVMPALMFVAVATTTRREMLSEAPFLLAVVVTFLTIYAATFFISTRVLHHSMGEAAIQANLTSYPSAAFMGPPIFRGLFGEASLFSIASAAVVGGITLVPLTVVLLELNAQRQADAGSQNPTGVVVRASVLMTLRQPMVFMPLLAAVLVLLNVRVPPLVDSMLGLIGSATAGTSLFLAGLIIAAYRVKFSPEVGFNVAVKMLAEPLLMTVMVLALGIGNPLAREAILIAAIPTAVFAPLLAPRYRVYEQEAASTLVLTSLAMIITLPALVIILGG